jgi:hypothetical protein
VAGTKPKAWSGHRLRSWLDAAAQVAVPFLEVLLVDEQEALEVLRERSIENRVFGMA